MRLALPQHTTPEVAQKTAQTWQAWLRMALSSWECYPILLLTAFLRLYRIDGTSFDTDQANQYRMAYDALHQGLIPLTAPPASIGSYNLPATIYMNMLPAAFTANPLAGALAMSFSGMIAVLVTYFFVRHYYGRIAGTFAALLFASMNLAVYYSRIIWNPAPLLLIAPLFILMLFRGAVSRRGGWFVPAVFLLGLMIQLHSSSALLAVALLAVVLLAPKTIRWHEWIWAALALLILYAPYLLWEIHTKFADINLIIQLSHKPSQIDSQAWLDYQLYLQGATPVPGSSAAFLNQLIWRTNDLLTPALILAVFVAIYQVLRPRQNWRAGNEPGQPFWKLALLWWNDFRADTYRCGLLLLILWQVIPVLDLSHHNLPIYKHYFIFLMPGQYILIAWLLSQTITWLQRFQHWGQLARYALTGLALLVILVQATASLVQVHALVDGSRSDGNDLDTLTAVFTASEQVAQQQRLKHIYISIYGDHYHMSGMSYLAEHHQSPVPVTLSNNACLILPGPSAGPVVFVEGPGENIIDTLLAVYTSFTLVTTVSRPEGGIYKIYVVQTKALQSNAAVAFGQNLQYQGAQQLSYQDEPWLVTSWGILHQAPIHYQTYYAYKFTNTSQPVQQIDAELDPDLCLLDTLQPGDELLRPVQLNTAQQGAGQVNLRVDFNTISPLIWRPVAYNPFGISFEIGGLAPTPIHILLANNGADHITIPLV